MGLKISELTLVATRSLRAAYAGTSTSIGPLSAR